MKELLEKYYNGTSSLQEEEALKKYFQEKQVEDEFLLDKKIFDFFEQEKKSSSKPTPKSTSLKRLIYISTGIAAIFILGFFIVKPHLQEQQNFAIINEQYITDEKILREYAQNKINTINAKIQKTEQKNAKKIKQVAERQKEAERKLEKYQIII